MTLFANENGQLADERGNIKVSAFGLTLSLIKAGESTDENGRKFAWSDSIKLILADGTRLKIDALQVQALREMLNIPEVSAELRARLEVEKAARMAALENI